MITNGNDSTVSDNAFYIEYSTVANPNKYFLLATGNKTVYEVIHLDSEIIYS